MGTYAASCGGVSLRATFAVLAAAAIFAGNEAWAGVGVTTAADGRPLGKPPNANERVLRIGIDVQANELVTTGAQDRAHLVFLDGSSLTVGTNARLTIDKFVFDPSTKTGELAVNATKGLFRLVGGKISKNNAITITTPSSTIGIRGGITIVAVTPTQTTADFIFGTSMTVTAGGRTQTATRPGSQVITAFGGVPGAPTLLKPGSLTATLTQLEGGRSNNRSPDQAAQSSGYSKQNSGQSANTPTLNQNGPPNTNNTILTNALSNATDASQPGNSTLVNAPTNNSPANPVGPPPNTPTNPITPINPNTPTGPTRTSQTLKGFASGMVTVTGGEINYRDSSSTRVELLKPGSASITTNAVSNQAKGTIEVGYQSATARLELGGAGHSVFTDDKTYSMTTDPSRQSTVRIGNSNPLPINDKSELKTSPAIQTAFQSKSGTCTCEFLTWGTWSSTGTVRDSWGDGITYDARGTYVAGTPSVQLPLTGSATYTGFMSGYVVGKPNLVNGSYQNSWDFAKGGGNFTGHFDDRTYRGMTNATGGTTFAGSFNSTDSNSTGGNRSGQLNGGFFASPSDAAKYQAGTFSIRGGQPHYQATGVFAGQR